MSDRAWMPLDIDDYMADTLHLSAAEHGAYMLLIMRYWKDGGLPNDERMIQRYSRLSAEQWAESRDVIAAFFGEGWSHKRIDAELTKATAIIEKRRNAANARHAGRKSDASAEQVQSKSTDTGVPPSTTNRSSSLRSDDRAPAKPTPRQHLESVLDAEHADAVIQHRQRIRKPMTERAAKMLATDLAKFPNPNDAADRMILKGWSSIDASWPDAWPDRQARGSPPLRMDDFLGTVIEQQERRDAGPDQKVESAPQALRAIPGGRWTG